MTTDKLRQEQPSARDDNGSLIAVPSQFQHADSSLAMDTDDTSLLANPANAMEAVHPLRTMAERIGKEVELFAEQLDQYRPKMQAEDVEEKREAVLELVGEYHGIASETVQRLRKMHGEDQKRILAEKYSGKPKEERWVPERGEGTENDTHVEDLERWQEELHTWDLAYQLLQVDFDQEDVKELTDGNGRFVADGKYWEDFLHNSKSGRERLILLRWLETTADITAGNDLDIIEEQLDTQTGRGTYDGWMDTKERIKGEKRLRLWDVPIDSTGKQAPQISNTEGTANIITQLDPDAPTRQKLTLEKDDLQFERSFWTAIWEMLRRGTPIDEVRSWCAERGQQARAYSIGALAAGTTLKASRRFLWRQACSKLAKTGGLTDQERAVYGLVSGDDRTVSALCSSWNDGLYMHCNWMLHKQYESWLAEQHNDLFPSTNNFHHLRQPMKLTKQESYTAEAKKTLNSLHSNERTRMATDNAQQRIQAALICHDMVEYIFQQGVALSKQAAKDESFLRLVGPAAAQTFTEAGRIMVIANDHDALRVLAHLFLVFQDLGLDFGDGARLEACENVLASYLQYLRLAGKFDLLPGYASRLSESRRHDVLARSCPEITDLTVRKNFVNLMLDAEVDAIAVLRDQMFFCFDLSPYSYRVSETDQSSAKITLMRPEPDHKWPFQRTRSYDEYKSTMTDLTSEEARLINGVRWFSIVEGAWAETFEALTLVAFSFLQNRRIFAAIALFEAMPASDISFAKSASHLDRAVDIMDDPSEDAEDSPATQQQTRPRTHRRRSSNLRAFAATTPDKKSLKRDLLRAHAHTYYDLETLTLAISALIDCASAETAVVIANMSPATSEIPLPAAKKHHRQSLDALVHAMEPLLHDFLHSPPPYIPTSALEALKVQYLPEMILAYATCLHAAGYLATREHLLQCLDLATDVAANETLIDIFKRAQAPGHMRRGYIAGEWDDGAAVAAEAAQNNGAKPTLAKRFENAREGGDDGKGTGRMKELVDAMASASKALLDLNDMQAGNGKAKERGSRRRMQRTVGIWDIERRGGDAQAVNGA